MNVLICLYECTNLLFTKLVHLDISSIKLLDAYDKLLLRYKHLLLLGHYVKSPSLHPCIIPCNLELSPGPDIMYNVCIPDIININTHLKTNTPLNNYTKNEDQYSSQLNNSALYLVLMNMSTILQMN